MENEHHKLVSQVLDAFKITDPVKTGTYNCDNANVWVPVIVGECLRHSILAYQSIKSMFEASYKCLFYPCRMYILEISQRVPASTVEPKYIQYLLYNVEYSVRPQRIINYIDDYCYSAIQSEKSIFFTYEECFDYCVNQNMKAKVKETRNAVEQYIKLQKKYIKDSYYLIDSICHALEIGDK